VNRYPLDSPARRDLPRDLGKSARLNGWLWRCAELFPSIVYIHGSALFRGLEMGRISAMQEKSVSGK
jgi:hypothetical protein